MMCKSVVLNLGRGNLETGFSFITALLEFDSQKIQVSGSLSPAPKLKEIYHRWQLLYSLIYPSRRSDRRSYRHSISIDKTGVTNVSDSDFSDVCQELENCLNGWLNEDRFLPIQHQLRNQFSPRNEIRFIVQTEDELASQLPWHIWQFFQDYPDAEVALSNFDFQPGKNCPNNLSKVRILAILGDAEGIDVETDRRLLEDLPHADTTFLTEPTRQDLNEQLWLSSGWDILFFAGHSSTENFQGKLCLNSNEWITITQLKNALQKAIARGLQLAIFNSCEGLGLARYLSDLNIPQTIVMREPVPDRVAHEFLKYFLEEFSAGKSFYLAVREAREKLQGLEKEFPGASWLPVIFQNPATATPTWQQLWAKNRGDLKQRIKINRVFWGSLIATTLIVGLRWLGHLQYIELQAFDHFTRLLPKATVDDRLLLIGADEEDISSQNYGYPLSDETLTKIVQKLESYQPAAIGIDIFRDSPIPPENKTFTTLLQQNPHLVNVCTGHDADNSIAPLVENSSKRSAFVDLYNDLDLTKGRDYNVRRYLLSRSPNPVSKESHCTTPYSLALQLAYYYFQSQKIPVTIVGKNWQFGSTEIERLQTKSGGYQKLDARGNQILIRYRNTPHIARQITVRELLLDDIDPAWVKNRIVLVGVTATTVKDFHDTSRGKMRGLHVHAHAVSQLLDSVEAKKTPLFWWLPLWGDLGWIWFWSFTGGLIVWIWQTPIERGITLGIGAISLYGCSWFVFTLYGWLPLVPAMLGLFLTSSGVIVYSSLEQKYREKLN